MLHTQQIVSSFQKSEQHPLIEEFPLDGVRFLKNILFMWVTCECEIMSTLHRLNSHTTKNSVRIFSHGVRIKYIQCYSPTVHVHVKLERKIARFREVNSYFVTRVENRSFSDPFFK